MRLRPSRRSRTTRASFRIRKCFEIAGRLTSKWSASSFTPWGRPSRYSRTARLVGSATARNGSAEYVTIWLPIIADRHRLVKHKGTTVHGLEPEFTLTKPRNRDRRIG